MGRNAMHAAYGTAVVEDVKQFVSLEWRAAYTVHPDDAPQCGAISRDRA